MLSEMRRSPSWNPMLPAVRAADQRI